MRSPLLLVAVAATLAGCGAYGFGASEELLAKALGDVKDPRLTIGKIDVTGDRATAEIRTSASGQAPSRDTLRLQRVRGAWRIASLGSA